MSENTKRLDRILKEGQLLAKALRKTVSRSSLSAHRNGACPNVELMEHYERTTKGRTKHELLMGGWLEAAELRRNNRRELAVKAIAGLREDEI